MNIRKIIFIALFSLIMVQKTNSMDWISKNASNVLSILKNNKYEAVLASICAAMKIKPNFYNNLPELNKDETRNDIRYVAQFYLILSLIMKLCPKYNINPSGPIVLNLAYLLNNLQNSSNEDAKYPLALATFLLGLFYIKT